MNILCQQCKQSHATVHLTDIQPSGEPVERHLCEKCATHEGVTMKPHEPMTLMLEKFVKLAPGLQEASQQVCPECGVSFSDFRSNGLLGCPHDYRVFGDILVPLISRAHDGAERHLGKVPGKPNKTGRARARHLRLKRELDSAVAIEDYETAARIRDELRQMEAELERDAG
jgi:protein arginine kinase activator